MSFGKLLKLVFLNTVLAIVLIICLSPGYLDLRLSDTSIFRAGCSVLVPLFSVILFLYGNRAILREKDYEMAENISDTDTAYKILSQYEKSETFGKTAKSALNQLSRLEGIRKGLPDVIADCFEPDSMSHAKYIGILDDACSALYWNVETMAKHINLFDEKNYRYLKRHYMEDEIPDAIQEEQIRQYEQEIAFIKNRLSLNEQMLVKLGDLKNNFLAMQGGEKNKLQESAIEDVERLAKELKYYEV